MNVKNTAQNKAPIKGMVSIIVPVYNAERFLNACINSALEQTYKNIELVLVNDGSVDKSRDICDEYALKDKRVKAIHKKNGGPSDARNVGIEHSRGEFIFFMDADDSITSDAIGLLIDGHAKSRADLIIGDFKIENINLLAFSEDRFMFSSDKELKEEDLVAYTVGYLKKPTGYSLFIYTWGKLFKSEIIRDRDIRFDTNLHVFEDITFNFNYLTYINSVYYIRKHIYAYMIYNNQVSAGSKIVENPAGFKYALRSIGLFLRNNNVTPPLLEKLLGNACIHFSIRVIMQLFSINKNFNSNKLYVAIDKIVKDPDVIHNLQFYTPIKGDSRIIPIFVKLRLIRLIIWVCRYKAYKRYRKISLKKG